MYADAAGNAICVKRSRIELLKAYIKMLKVFRLIDLHYDKVCEEYRKNHSKLESKSINRNTFNIFIYAFSNSILLRFTQIAFPAASAYTTSFQRNKS